MIESFFIEIYSLLAHRIKGLGWSLDDFWKCDTWTTSKLYCMELELIKEEDKKVSRIFRYQRYVLVWDDEYVYHISFVEKPDEWEKKIQSERAAKEYQKSQREREIAEAEIRRKGTGAEL